MKDFLDFKKMITPVIIQVIFWLGVLASVIAGIIAIFKGNIGVPLGLFTIILGPIVVRVICEILIVIFAINNTLTETKNLLKDAQRQMS